MHSLNPKVDEFFTAIKKWKSELEALRMICLDCGLTEDLKWGVPCYTLHGKNIVGLNRFKQYCALAFFNGVSLSDPYSILIQPGKVQTGRYIRFINVAEIAEMEPIIKAYIFEAIEVENAGLKVTPLKSSDYPVPVEFQTKLDEFSALKVAFNALTPGRQRAYNLYFSQPKQSKTREARIEKYIPKILSGKGMND